MDTVKAQAWLCLAWPKPLEVPLTSCIVMRSRHNRIEVIFSDQNNMEGAARHYQLLAMRGGTAAQRWFGSGVQCESGSKDLVGRTSSWPWWIMVINAISKLWLDTSLLCIVPLSFRAPRFAQKHQKGAKLLEEQTPQELSVVGYSLTPSTPTNWGRIHVFPFAFACCFPVFCGTGYILLLGWSTWTWVHLFVAFNVY